MRKKFPHLLIATAGSLFLLTLGSVVIQAQSTKASMSENEQELIRAQTEYYQVQTKKLLEPPAQKRWMQNIVENPASVLGVLGAFVAALVALISFGFNYRATLQNQRDTQFYEALKRFGDGKNPTMRLGATGMLVQMAKRKTHRFTLQPKTRFRKFERPYLGIARDQLANGLLVEENNTGILMIGNALSEIIAIEPNNEFELLAGASFLLQNDLATCLADFFAVSGVAKISDITTEKWEQAAAMTPYPSDVLRALIRTKTLALSDVFTDRTLTFTALPPKKQLDEIVKCHQNLRTAAFRLLICAQVCAEAFTAWPGQESIPLKLGIFLANTDLKGANFRGKTLHDANLINANLEDVNLSEASLNGVLLMGANLNNTKLWRARINNVTNLDNANWWQADFSDKNGGNIDKDLLNQLRERYGDKLGNDKGNFHPSVAAFLESTNA